eukprot:5664204-Prymnesium_polylepis.1
MYTVLSNLLWLPQRINVLPESEADVDLITTRPIGILPNRFDFAKELEHRRCRGPLTEIGELLGFEDDRVHLLGGEDIGVHQGPYLCECPPFNPLRVEDRSDPCAKLVWIVGWMRTPQKEAHCRVCVAPRFRK